MLDLVFKVFHFSAQVLAFQVLLFLQDGRFTVAAEIKTHHCAFGVFELRKTLSLTLAECSQLALEIFDLKGKTR